MQHQIEKHASSIEFRLAGELVSTDRKTFEAAIPDLLETSPREIVVDLKRLSYMDSVGLGMLVTLYERARNNGAAVVLRQPQGTVKKLLETAAFDRLMRIE
ncbi:MAG: anti-sigma factor antagonist [Azospirillum sp.]|nr:anti-sigma factor antagonist [Azospirillum sp.]